MLGRRRETSGGCLLVDGVSASRGRDLTVAEAASDPSATLRTKVANGVRWGIIISIATQVARIVFLIALMRLLGPRNYGIVGQAAIIIAVANMFVNFGLAVSIVQRPVLDQGDVGTAFWLNVAAGSLLAVLTVLGAPLLSSFFMTEELTAVFRVLSIALVLKAMTIVPAALLTRHMQFRSIAIVEITSTFMSGALGVGAAAMGAGYWALVIQTVSFEAFYLLLILCIGGLPDLAWSATAARRLWSFSSRVMGADLVNYVSGNTDRLLVAKFLGPSPLALYSLAFRVLELTLAVLGQVSRVVLPTFARLQDDRERLVRAFVHVTESASLAVCPLMTLVILIAPVVVPAVFGEAWADAVVPLQLIAAATIPYVLGGLMGPLTIAIGRADWEFRWSVAIMVVHVIAFSVGLQWGIVGMATTYLIMLAVGQPIRFAIIQRLIPISGRSYLRALAPATTCSVAAGVMWLLTQSLLLDTANGRILIAAASLIGAAAYVIALRLAWSDDFRRQLDFARLVVGGERR
jgi:PST family polysaccharide transporter